MGWGDSTSLAPDRITAELIFIASNGGMELVNPIYFPKIKYVAPNAANMDRNHNKAQNGFVP